MATKIASTFNFNGFTVTRKTNTLLITAGEESTKKYWYTDDLKIVNSMIAGINALSTNHFAEMIHASLYLHKTMEEIKATPFYENAGYAYARYLPVLDEQGLLRRERDVKPGALYRLDWDGFGFKTAEVVYKKYEKGEYEGVGGPKHNRNTLSLIEGIQRVKNTVANGANVELGVLLMNQEYLNKILSGWTLICKGKAEEAKVQRNNAITGARVKGAIERIQKLAETKPELVKELNDGVSTLRMWDGTKNGVQTPVEELFGKTVEYHLPSGAKMSNAPVLVERGSLANLKRAEKANMFFKVIE